MKNKIISVKNHFDRNRFKYGVATGLSAGLWLVQRNAAITNEFLQEHDLFDEFYVMDEV